jgi:hypothetical protein
MLCSLLMACVSWFNSGSPEPHTVQGTDDGGRRIVFYRAEHIDAVRAEREAELQALAAAASAEQRALASTLLAATPGDHRPAMRPVDFEVLAAARQALLGATGGELAALSLSLDLRLVPGCFEVRREGRGEAMTVSLERLWRGPGRAARVSLFWVAPDGKRSRARSEPVTAAAFERGFEMYIRPPMSAPGRWHLTVELEAAGETAPGIPIPVDCVADLASWREPEDSAAGRAFAERLDLLLELGLRRGSLATLAEQHAILRGAPEAGVLLMPSAVAGVILCELNPQSPMRRSATVLVASAPGRGAIESCFGPEGRAWRDLARNSNLRVFVASLPAGEHAVAPWLSVIAELAEAGKGDEMILALRGELALLLPQAIERAPAASVAALVLYSSPATFSSLAAPAPCPMLFVSGASAGSGYTKDGTPRTRISRSEADLLLPPEVPALLLDWWSRE